MFVDGNLLPNDHHRLADVLIVGAGAAGIPLAAELGKAKLSVLLLETGGLKTSPTADALSRGRVENPHHGPLDRYRVRRFGGTTSVWGGRVAPLDEIDFQPRDHVESEGWPLGRSALVPSYEKAHAYLRAGPFEYDANASGFESSSFHQRMVWRFSEPVDLGRAWHKEFSRWEALTVLLNTSCVKLEMNESGSSVARCHLRTLNGRSLVAEAKVVVLAAGGLESTRLLLTSRSQQHPEGVGNHSGMLGRFYSSHLAGTLGPFRWLSDRRIAGLRYERDREGTYIRRTLSLKPERQVADGLLNFRANVSVPSLADPSHSSAVLSAAFLAKRFILKKIPPEFDAKFARSTSTLRSAHVKNVVTRFPELLAFGPWWMVRRVLPRRKIPSMEPKLAQSFFLHFDAEQSPLYSSRVTLDDEIDPLGVPRLRVDWRVRDSDVTVLARIYSLLRDEMSAAGVAEAVEDSESVESRIGRELGVGSHHIGTTRMANSAEKGVTDAECRVHGVSNLYIASSSVFPTTGVANPTLTITAVALRIGDRIIQELGKA